MGANVVDRGELRSANRWSPSRTLRPPAKFIRLSQLRRLRGCEQVAAVCYRVRGPDIEFLLVRTNSGHWTFPKGNTEPGLTHAQAAALEAFEEAGVHGRMEEASFTRYIRRKRAGDSAARSAKKEIVTQVHLCEVLRLDRPQEISRTPTWFSADKAKRRLGEERTPTYAAELARVVDRAVMRIQRLRSGTGAAAGRRQEIVPQKVQFIDSVRRATVKAKASGRTG